MTNGLLTTILLELQQLWNFNLDEKEQFKKKQKKKRHMRNKLS